MDNKHIDSANREGGKPIPVAGDVLSASWLLDHELGIGGMATVFAAIGVDGQRAALKIMHGDLALEPGALQRFLREGVIAQRIHHPAMVRSLGQGTTDTGCPYLALELLEGSTVEDLWRSSQHRPSVPNLLHFFVGVLDLLAFCHDQGIVHRDLKPANIYVTHDGSPKVLDFGVARARGLNEDFLTSGMSMGTPTFIAPEQAMGAWDHVDERADVVSIGATLFALLSGERLHQGRSKEESFKLAATKPAPSLRSVAPTLPPKLIELVDRALQWDKRKRFANAKEMKRVLEQIILGFGVEPTPMLPPLPDLPPPSLPRCSPSSAKHAWVEAFSLFEKCWQVGWDEQKAQKPLELAVSSLGNALDSEPRGLKLTLLPHCLRVQDETIWAPNDPFAGVLARMFAEGIRSVEVRPTCPRNALRSMLSTLVRHASTPDHGSRDMVCDLWPLKTNGIHIGIASGLLGTASSFTDSTAEDHRTVGRILDAAGGICERASTAPAARNLVRFVWDEKARQDAIALAGPPNHDDSFAKYLAAVLTETSLADTESLLHPVAEDLLRDRRPDLLLATMAKVARSETPDAVLGLMTNNGIRSIILFAAEQERQGLPELDRTVEQLHDALLIFGPRGVPFVLETLPELESSKLNSVLVAYVEKCLPQHAKQVGASLFSMSGETGYRLLRALYHAGEGAEELAALAACINSPLSIAAQVLTGDPELAIPAVLEQLSAPSWPARQVAILTIVENKIERGWNPLLRLVESTDFHRRTPTERVATLNALYALNRTGAEKATQALVRKYAIVRDEALNDTRILAAELLGQQSYSSTSIAALRAAEAPMWWNSPQIRKAAHAARRRMEHRMSVAKVP